MKIESQVAITMIIAKKLQTVLEHHSFIVTLLNRENSIILYENNLHNIERCLYV